MNINYSCFGSYQGTFSLNTYLSNYNHNALYSVGNMKGNLQYRFCICFYCSTEDLGKYLLSHQVNE